MPSKLLEYNHSVSFFASYEIYPKTQSRCFLWNFPNSWKQLVFMEMESIHPTAIIASYLEYLDDLISVLANNKEAISISSVQNKVLSKKSRSEI